MMGRTLGIVIALAALPLGGAGANEPSFDDRVRDYLLQNPEVILEALEVLSERERQAAMQDRITAFPELISERTGLGIGDAEAPIRVVEFFDYKCAPCKALHPVLVSFVTEHPELRVDMRHLPILSPGSERAARFALAVQQLHGDTAYELVHEHLWSVRGALNSEVFARIADDLSLDFAALSAAAESDAVTDRITYNRDAAIALGVLGTPAFVTPTSVTFGTTDIERLADAWLPNGLSD